MPKKKGGKKKKKGRGKKKVMVGNETPGQVLKRFLRTYERNCVMSNTLVCPSLRATVREMIESDKVLPKFILEPVPGTSEAEAVVCIEPLLSALRQERYTLIQNLHVWDIPLRHQHVAALALLLEKSVYPIDILELMECDLAAESLRRLSVSFNACRSLSTIILDYNDFGDLGCEGLCKGLEGNKTIISVSLNYCGLGVPSGKLLGHMVCFTAVRELYLDGNDLECEGAVEVIKMCVDRAEEEAFLRDEEERLKLEEEALEAQMAKDNRRHVPVPSSGGSDAGDKEEPGSAGKKGKKKKKKGRKKKKGPPPPPPVGPWIYKLHLADNGIDALGSGGQLAPLVCVRLFRRLVANSKCLEELDLEDNLIGDVGGKEIMEALQDRKDAGLGGVKLRATHRMNSDTFNTIVKLGAGLKKKKKKRGKKKKKK